MADLDRYFPRFRKLGAAEQIDATASLAAGAGRDLLIVIAAVIIASAISVALGVWQ